jgi:hypothetical protein
MPRPKRPAGSDEPIIQARRLEALDLRKAGFSYAAIGNRLQVSGEQARLDVMAALKQLSEHQDTETAEYRSLELERLDRMLVSVWSDALKGHLGAIDRVLKISERRSRLMGLDAPVKQEHSGNVGVTWRDLVEQARSEDNS